VGDKVVVTDGDGAEFRDMVLDHKSALIQDIGNSPEQFTRVEAAKQTRRMETGQESLHYRTLQLFSVIHCYSKERV
jgi:hypothetical protein